MYPYVPFARISICLYCILRVRLPISAVLFSVTLRLSSGSCMKCVYVCMDVVSAAPWADWAARTKVLRPVPPDLCSGSTTASSWTTAERARIRLVSCLPCRTICPTAAVSVATLRNLRYDKAVTAALHAGARGTNELISKGMLVCKQLFSGHLLCFNSPA